MDFHAIVWKPQELRTSTFDKGMHRLAQLCGAAYQGSRVANPPGVDRAVRRRSEGAHCRQSRDGWRQRFDRQP